MAELTVAGRPLSSFARAPFERHQLNCLRGILTAYEKPLDGLGRYALGRGTYPHRIAVRTPLGVMRPTLHSHDDLLTATEVFCRMDYPAGDDVEVVVDVGSNIGLSALYFLTRNRRARVHLFEPDPRNLPRLRENLAGFEDRYELDEAAVSDTSGREAFGLEPTGRYGGLGWPGEKTIEVQTRAINDVLEAVLEREKHIDVLKLDTEDYEILTVRAIRPDLLGRIGRIYLDAAPAAPLYPERFTQRQYGTVLQMKHRGLDRAD